MLSACLHHFTFTWKKFLSEIVGAGEKKMANASVAEWKKWWNFFLPPVGLRMCVALIFVVELLLSMLESFLYDTTVGVQYDEKFWRREFHGQSF